MNTPEHLRAICVSLAVLAAAVVTSHGSSQLEAPSQLQARVLGNGPSVVLLGGGLLGADGWGDVPQVLAKTRRAINLQSLVVQHGPENRPLPSGYSIQTEVDALRRTLDTVSVDAPPQRVADLNFDTRVAKPAYATHGPRVLFDEAHHNVHTSAGLYKPFADLITADGYRVTPTRRKFTRTSLTGFDILVISNALGAAAVFAPEASNPTFTEGASNPAFTEEECDAVRDWVRAGGALLLIADHSPMGAANEGLGRRFGIDMSNGHTRDTANTPKEDNTPGLIVYTRERGLAEHPVTMGRLADERLHKVLTFTGQSLKGPAGSVAFMRLADTAVDHLPPDRTRQVSAAGRAQGIALLFGRGRAVVLAEAGMLSAQLAGPNRALFGMNRPGIDNRQLALNIMHWLSRKI